MDLVAQRRVSLPFASAEVPNQRDRLVIFLVWCVYSTLLAFVIANHEPWFDEAQAWLLARDSSLGALVTHNLRYEGTPGLWHYILAVPAKLGLPYCTMSWLAGCIASGGVLVFLLKAPFPKWIRYLFPFSFFLFYQYAVIARSYVLLPLLLFAIASIYRQVDKRPVLFSCLAILLANVSLHGFLLASALVAMCVLRTVPVWPQLDPSNKVRLLAGFSAFALVAFMIVLQLRRPPDLASFGALNLSLRHLAAVSVLKLGDAFTGSVLLSAPLLVVSVWWFYTRHTLLLFVLGSGGLLALAGIAYSNVWHEGSLVLWWAFVMWISWPASSIAPRPVLACWLVLLAVQSFWSLRASWFDVRFAYSGSKEMASYIKSQQLDRLRIFAFGPKSAAILPYFGKNIFANWPPQRSFWLWSTGNNTEASFADISRAHPDYVILPVTRESDQELVSRQQSLHGLGYELSRRFSGALYWKSRILEGDTYEIYQARASSEPNAQSLVRLF